MTPEERAKRALPCGGGQRQCDANATRSGHWYDCPAVNRPAVECEIAAAAVEAMLLQLQVDHSYLVKERARAIEAERARVLRLTAKWEHGDYEHCTTECLRPLIATIESGAEEMP
jgi:hypothetical protein